MIPGMRLLQIRAWGTAALLVAGHSIAIAQEPMPWTLEPHVVSSDLRGAYAVVASDVNNDGKTDLIAVAGATRQLIWFENPSWTRHVIASEITGLINAAAADTDKDGIPEIAIATGFATLPAKSTGIVTVYTHGANVNEPWQGKEIDRTPASHRLRFADIEGNGRKWLINAPLAGAKAAVPDYKDQNTVYAYNPVDWKRQIVTDAEDGVMHGILAADWDGKGRDALLTASFLGVHLHRYNNGKWTRTRLVEGNPAPWPQNGAGEVAMVRAKNARILATIEPFHGNEAPRPDTEVVTYSGSGDKWDGRTVIDKGLNYGHALEAVDLDGDGADELVAGYMGKPNGINVYRRNADGAWSKFVLESNAMPGSGCTVADFNNDKRMDLACTGGTTLKWYENKASK
ncbi:MAG TPA: VCBS repeat-containing protein [Vicinamibacterales bacterium]